MRVCREEEALRPAEVRAEECKAAARGAEEARRTAVRKAADIYRAARSENWMLQEK